jgi:type II secretory pathway component GspD/PulD (secretin)
VNRNELIILITPRVIRDMETQRIITEDSRTLHKEADKYATEKEVEFRKLLLEAQKKKQQEEEKREKFIEKEADKPREIREKQ